MPEDPRSGVPHSVIGTSFVKVDAAAKVAGQTVFADDLVLPRMVFAKLLRSPHPHARVLRVDVTKAAALPGVVATLVGAELPIPFGILPVSQDEHALALDKVRFVGRSRGRGGGGRRGNRGGGAPTGRRRLRGLARADDDRRGPGPPRRANPRLRAARQRPQGGLVRLRRRGRRLRRGRPRARGHLLLRGQHPSAPGAARRGWLTRPRRQAHALVLDPDAALRPPGAREGARDARPRTSA